MLTTFNIFQGHPSSVIPFTIVNILYGYAYLTKIHNGDHFSSVHTFAQVRSDHFHSGIHSGLYLIYYYMMTILCLVQIFQELQSVCQAFSGVNFIGPCEAVHDCIRLIENDVR